MMGHKICCFFFLRNMANYLPIIPITPSYLEHCNAVLYHRLLPLAEAIVELCLQTDLE